MHFLCFVVCLLLFFSTGKTTIQNLLSPKKEPMQLNDAPYRKARLSVEGFKQNHTIVFQEIHKGRWKRRIQQS